MTKKINEINVPIHEWYFVSANDPFGQRTVYEKYVSCKTELEHLQSTLAALCNHHETISIEPDSAGNKFKCAICGAKINGLHL